MIVMLLVYGEACYSGCQVIQSLSMWIQKKSRKPKMRWSNL